jgi:ABC-2 type transport system ATP-binding protein
MYRPTSMLSVRNLTVEYGEHQVLQELYCDFHDEYIHGIIGLNGQGKTTLLNCISGLSGYKTGTITFGGGLVHSTQTAFLQTEMFFYPLLTGAEHLRLMSTRNATFDGEAWNEVFHLPLHQLISTYSAGMKKKLAFLGVIALDRQIIILDEPFNNVDMETHRLFVAIMRQLARKGRVILVTSHIIEPLLGVCDAIDWLHDKRIKQRFTKSGFDDIESQVFGDRQDAEIARIKELL